MRKITTIFKRNPDNMSEVTSEPNPECTWVLEEEGVATRKYDGTCVMIKDGHYFKRREVKKDRDPPEGFIESQYDDTTGKRVGWVLVDPSDPGNKWHMEAYSMPNPECTWVLEEEGVATGGGWFFEEAYCRFLSDGTYELCGPKIQGNPENVDCHRLVRHSKATRYDVPRSYDGLKAWLADKPIEGLVFHHPDGRMAKIKKKDFGIKR